MARRRQLTPLAMAINICMELNDGDKQTLVDVLRSRNGNKPTVPKSTVPTAPKRSSVKSGVKSTTASIEGDEGSVGSVINELARATGRSIADCTEAMEKSGGSKKAAMLVLTAEGS